MSKVRASDRPGTSNDTNWGFGLRAALGKEWWVSDHWGLGIAGHVSLTVNQDSGTNPPTWTGLGATVAFSATYNNAPAMLTAAHCGPVGTFWQNGPEIAIANPAAA